MKKESRHAVVGVPRMSAPTGAEPIGWGPIIRVRGGRISDRSELWRLDRCHQCLWLRSQFVRAALNL